MNTSYEHNVNTSAYINLIYFSVDNSVDMKRKGQYHESTGNHHHHSIEIILIGQLLFSSKVYLSDIITDRRTLYRNGTGQRILYRSFLNIFFRDLN